MYEHTQLGYVTFTAFRGGAGAALVLSLRTDGQMKRWAGIVLGAGLLAGAVLFSSLTVSVHENALRFYFGPGFWEQRIPHEDIKQVRVVQNPLWYGWGLRDTPDGWVYNVSGFQAVEIRVADEERIRIGTDEPRTLKKALGEASPP